MIVGVLFDCVIVAPWAGCWLEVGCLPFAVCCCSGPSSSPSSMAAEGLPYKDPFAGRLAEGSAEPSSLFGRRYVDRSLAR